jgi:cofilin
MDVDTCNRERLAKAQDMPSMTSTTNCLPARVRGNSDIEFNLDGSDKVYRSKITFIAWSPDDAGIQVWIICCPCSQFHANEVEPKMVYASSKDALKRALNGIATEFQANDEEDIEYQSVLKKVSKGGA